MSATAATSTMTSNAIIPKELDIEQTTSSESTASSSASTSLSTANPEPEFTLFPKLPIELRLKIWKLSKEPRIVEVCFQKDGRKNKHKYFTKNPALLHVCHESRVEGLKWYKRAFLNKWAANGVYFDFTNDILYLYSSISSWHPKKLDYFLNRQKDGDLGKVQRLALEHFDTPTAPTLSKFTAMREFIVATRILTYTHPTGACPTNRLGLHDADELIESNSDKADIHSELQYSKHFFAQYQMTHQEKFPDNVLFTHKICCELQAPSRFFR